MQQPEDVQVKEHNVHSPQAITGSRESLERPYYMVAGRGWMARGLRWELFKFVLRTRGGLCRSLIWGMY